MKVAKPVSSAFGKVNAEHMLDKSLMFGCGIFSNIGMPGRSGPIRITA